MLEFALQCHKGMTIHRYRKRCSRFNNIISCRVEEPENNIHHNQEGSRWKNFFKNVKYNIFGVTVKATIVWAIVYVIAIIINSVGNHFHSVCEKGNFFQRTLCIIATGVRPEDYKRKRAKLRVVISCCVFNVC